MRQLSDIFITLHFYREDESPPIISIIENVEFYLMHFRILNKIYYKVNKNTLKKQIFYWKNYPLGLLLEFLNGSVGILKVTPKRNPFNSFPWSVWFGYEKAYPPVISNKPSKLIPR